MGRPDPAPGLDLFTNCVTLGSLSDSGFLQSIELIALVLHSLGAVVRNHFVLFF